MQNMGNISEYYKKYFMCEFLDSQFVVGLGLDSFWKTLKKQFLTLKLGTC